MPRFPRFLILFLTLSLLFAACRPQTADRRPQADGGQPTVPSPALVLSPSPTPTETAIPRPSLESLSLFAETQALLKRQGWDIAWDSQNARYLIRQRAWDEASQTFTSQLTHEAGWIDLEGNLHFTATYFSAQENEDGTWQDTSTTRQIIINLKTLSAQAQTETPTETPTPTRTPTSNPTETQSPTATATETPEIPQIQEPGFHLLETKNPAFEKTGILTLTYLDENGIPQTVTYNRELNFLQMPEISTDLLHPTPLPIEAVHSLAALQFILLCYGDGEPFPMEAINEPPQWAIQFHYNNNGTADTSDDTKDAVLIPHNGHRDRYIRFVGEGESNLDIPWFMIVLPNGTAYPSAPVEIFNPKDPQNPKDGNEKLILFPVFLGEMTAKQRYLFSLQYLNPNQFSALFKERRIYLAQEGGFFSKANIGKWTDFYDPSSLDSLLGMEGNDVKTQLWEQSNGAYANISGALGYLDQLNSNKKIIETTSFLESLPPDLQKLVLPLSP